MINNRLHIPVIALCILVVPVVVSGCKGPDSGASRKKYDLLSEYEKRIRSRYDDFISLRMANVILDTTLNPMTLQDIDAVVHGSGVSDWKKIDWSCVKRAVEEAKSDSEIAPRIKKDACVKCALWPIDPPIENVVWLSVFPFVIEQSRTHFDMAILVFCDEKLVNNRLVESR